MRSWPPAFLFFHIFLKSPFSSATSSPLLVWVPHFPNAGWGFALYSACPSWSPSHLLGLKEYCLLSASKLMPVEDPSWEGSLVALVFLQAFMLCSPALPGLSAQHPPHVLEIPELCAMPGASPSLWEVWPARCLSQVL